MDKDSVTSKIEELRTRLAGLDRAAIEAKIIAHPLPAIGAAFALGVLVAIGTHKPKSAENEVKRGIGGAMVAGLGAVAVRLLKSYAISHLGDAAKNWIGGDQTNPTERVASMDPAVESFVRH